MKNLILLFVPLVLLASDKPKANERKPAPKQGTAAPKQETAGAVKPAAPVEVTVPPDATPVGPYAWRHTDKDGKTWIYRKTPFGLSKVEEQPMTSAVPMPPPPKVKVVDNGDSYRFEKPTPMGPRVWERKKTELTEEEKTFVAAERGEKPAASEKQ